MIMLIALVILGMEIFHNKDITLVVHVELLFMN